MTLWIAIVVSAALCYGWKYAGLSVPDRVLVHPQTAKVVDLIPIALLAALISVQVFARETTIVIDARLAGLAVAGAMLLVRAPFLVVVFGAALAAAAIRQI